MEANIIVQIGFDTKSLRKHENRGLRQGSVLSPDLFNLYGETFLRELENLPRIIITLAI